MLPILAAVLAFITIGGLGWAFVGGGDSSEAAVKRAQTFGGPKQNNSAAKKAAAANTPEARRKAFLQVAMEQNMGCAVGACLGCVIWGTDGPQRVCREGPVFAAEEVDWEATAGAGTHKR